MREEDLKAFWKQQNAEPIQMTTEQIQLRAASFQRAVRRRNLAEYIACAIVILAFSAYIWIFPNRLMMLGSLMEILATLFVAYRLRTQGRSRGLPSADVGSSFLTFHIGELSRQRDFVRSAWYWYVVPLMAGLLVFVWGMVRMVPPEARGVLLGFGVVVVALGVLIGFANISKARDLQREIDTLVSLRAKQSDGPR
jgi:H+/Cl- antiporter ClcA